MSKYQLERILGWKASLSIVVGTVVGSGIFIRPAETARLLGNPFWMLGAWLLAGLLTLFLAMVMAELSAHLPGDGGGYGLMRQLYGDFWAFLYGWASFIVINCAGTAGIAFVFAEYINQLIPLPEAPAKWVETFTLYLPGIGIVRLLEHLGIKLLTLILILVLTAISYRNTRSSSILQMMFTLAKALALGWIVFGMLGSGMGDIQHFFHANKNGNTGPSGDGLLWIAAFAAALNGALQAYDGMSNMLNMSGEIRNPGKTIPRGLIGGILVCMVLYLAVIVAYLYVLSPEEMASSDLVAYTATHLLWGEKATWIITILICLSVLGTTHTSVLTPPRISYAMACDGLFFRMAGKIHPKYRTPGNALLLHAVVMAVMVFSGSFYILTNMYIFIVWCFNLFFLWGIFRLRRRSVQLKGFFRLKGYPWLPAVLFLGCLVYLGFTVYADVTQYLAGQNALIHSFAGILLTLTGIPFYWWFRRKGSAFDEH